MTKKFKIPTLPQLRKIAAAHKKALALIAKGAMLFGRTKKGARLADFSGFDFSHCAKARDFLSNGDWTYAKFNFARLPFVTFKGHELKKASFVGADLRYAKFCYRGIEGCDFSDTICTDANFERVLIENSVFNRARMLRVNIKRAVFLRCELQNTLLSEVNAIGAYFDTCDLMQASFFRGALHRALISDSRLTDADFTSAQLRDGIMHGPITANFASANSLPRFPQTQAIHLDRERDFVLRVDTAPADGPIFSAGCRVFSLERALEHWGVNHCSPGIARAYVAAILKWCEENDVKIPNKATKRKTKNAKQSTN